MPLGNILVADDDSAIRTVLNQALSRAGYQVRLTSNAATLWRWVSEGDGDLLITDVVMPDENIFDLLPRIKRARPELPIIVMSAQNTFMTAIRASERGAYEYLPKPFDLKELIAIVGRALSEPRTRRSDAATEEPVDNIPLVGRSPAMQDIYRVLARLMQTDLTVMIAGESGTGKELVARALHDYGKRRNGPFVPINMAAIPRDLIEAELFGHEKGAFTGAQGRSAGRFEQADGGTLFLDEICELKPAAQDRLLQFVLQRRYRRVGGDSYLSADVRLVVATSCNLEARVRARCFSADLLAELSTATIAIPPLQERPEDVAVHARNFLESCARSGGGRPQGFSAEALEVMTRYDWPGNVAELRSVVERAAAVANGEEVLPEHLPAELLSAAAEADGVAEADGGGISRPLAEIERQAIQTAMDRSGGNLSQVARELGVSRTSLYDRIARYGLRRPTRRKTDRICSRGDN